MIDGWSIDSWHFAGIFATFTEDDTNEVCDYLLSCNVTDDFYENTEFDSELPESLKKFGFTAADWFDEIIIALEQ